MTEYKEGKFIIKPSSKKGKKYDVFEHGKYILSFGAKNYQHYFDKFGYYKDLNHLDKKRRANYRARAKGIGNLDNPYSANFWAYHYLW